MNAGTNPAWAGLGGLAVGLFGALLTWAKLRLDARAAKRDGQQAITEAAAELVQTGLALLDPLRAQVAELRARVVELEARIARDNALLVAERGEWQARVAQLVAERDALANRR